MAAVAAPSSVEQHNRVVRQGMRRAAELEPMLARAVLPTLIGAGNDAAAAFSRLATNHLTASVPGVTSRSTMVALVPRPAEAQALAGLTGADPETLHLTLAFLGETDGDLERVAVALARVSATHAPLAGQVGGVGSFGDGEDGAPAILLPSIPGLVELRVDVTEALIGAEVEYGRDHGYQPHLTVDYRDDGSPPSRAAIGATLHFDHLLIVRGDEEVARLPLTGARPLTAAGDPGGPGWTAPVGDEMVDVDEIVGKLRGKTDPVRQAVVETTMTAALDNVGIDFDIDNPHTAQVLASSGQHITYIAETTRTNVNRIVGASYREGLSIRDTARAIRQGMREASVARSVLIARTEMTGAVNGGSLAATKIVQDATGVKYEKQWLTGHGAKHPRHERYVGLNGQLAGLDGYFDVGGYQLQYPGDSEGPPREICNCRCSLSYVESAVAKRVPADDTGGLPVEDAPQMTAPGEPLRAITGQPFASPVYHGTVQRIATKIEKSGGLQPDDNGLVFVSTSRADAELYAGERAEDLSGRPVVMQGEIAVKNPIVLPYDAAGIETAMTRLGLDPAKFNEISETEIARAAREAGHDAVFWGEDGATIALVDPPKLAMTVARDEPQLGVPSPLPVPSVPPWSRIDNAIRDVDARAPAEDALALIARVHRVPAELAPLRITEMRGGGTGIYDPSKVEIRGTWYGDAEEVETVVHEYGHHLDWALFGKTGVKEGSTSGAMTELLDTIRAGDRFKRLPMTKGPGRDFREPWELFARAYEQWIATETADLQLLKLQADYRRLNEDAAFWDAAEFEPIAVKMRALFEERGLLVKKAPPPPVTPPLPVENPWGIKVVPATPAPNVGIAAVPLRGGLGDASALTDMRAGADAGHFGTGVRFVDRADLLGPLLEERAIGVDLTDRNLWKPNTAKHAEVVYEKALKQLDDLAAYDAPLGVFDDILLDDIAITLPGELGSGEVLRKIVLATRADRVAGNLNVDSASTRAMKHLGYDGVDTRAFPELEHTKYGSVLYRRNPPGVVPPIDKEILDRVIPVEGRPFAHLLDHSLRAQISTSNKIIREALEKDPTMLSLTDKELAKAAAAKKKLEGLLAERDYRRAHPGVKPPPKPRPVTVVEPRTPPPPPRVMSEHTIDPARMNLLHDAYEARKKTAAMAPRTLEKKTTAAGRALFDEVDARLAQRHAHVDFKYGSMEDRERGPGLSMSTWLDNREAAIRLRREMVTEVLSEVRSMGTARKQAFTPSEAISRGSQSSGVKIGAKSEERVSKELTKSAQFYPTDWVDAANRSGPIDMFVDKRGYHWSPDLGGVGRPPRNRQIVLSNSDSAKVKTDGKMSSVATHEIGHMMEDLVPGVRKAEDVFYSRRTKGNKVELYGGGGKTGEKAEYVRRDEFVDRYTGKDYSGLLQEARDVGSVVEDTTSAGNSFEVLTMGMQAIFHGDADIWTRDTDHRDFILGLLVSL